MAISSATAELIVEACWPEGFLLLPERLFFWPPHNPIAVTQKMLLEAANAGKWPLEYPVHKGPPRRYDILASNAPVS
jgi:hypothetical protein